MLYRYEDNYMTSRKIGFTLAEILIALVIIGIIAAITVPTIIHKSDEYRYKAALLKNYKILSEAFKLTYGYNYDDFKDWNYVHSTNFTRDAFDRISKYFQIEKVCGSGTNMKNCWADKTYAKNGKQYAYWFGNNGTYNGGEEAFSFVLNDGTSLILDVWNDNTMNIMGIRNDIILSNASLGFFVDINGAKKPNKLGYDVFNFALTKKGIVPGGIDNKGANCNNLNINYNWDCAIKVIGENK